MNVMIIATKGCSHCQNFSRELDDIGIEHEVKYAEDIPKICQSLNIRHSPNLVVDDFVIFRKQPTEIELREFFEKVGKLP